MTLKPSLACLLILAAVAPAAHAQGTTPAQLQKAHEAAAGVPAQDVAPAQRPLGIQLHGLPRRR